MNRQMRVSHTTGLFLWIVITAGIYCFYYFIQPSLTYAECILCDGNQYLALYEKFSGHEADSVQFPYYSRIFVPWLASLLPFSNPIKSFQLLNLIFAVLGVATIYRLWTKLHLPPLLIIIGLLWLVFHWIGIIRLNAQDPLTVDVPVYFVEVLFIVILLDRKFEYLWLLAPLAIFQKESLSAFMAAFVFYAALYERKELKTVLIHVGGPLLAALFLKTLFTFYYPPSPSGDKNAAITILTNMVSFFAHPFLIVRAMVALFFAYGCFILLAFVKLKDHWPKEGEYRLFLWMSIVAVALGITGGGDYTRLTFLGFPFVMTFILLLVKELNSKVWWVAFIFSIPLMRIFSAIPDPGKDFSTFAAWYPEFAPPALVAGWAGYLIVCCLIMFVSNRLIK